MIATNKSRKVVRPAPRLGAWAQTATTWKSKELVLTHRAKGSAIGLRARCASNLSPDVRAGGYWRPAGQTSASRAGRTDWLDPRICLSRKGTGIRFKLKFCVSVADAFDGAPIIAILSFSPISVPRCGCGRKWSHAEAFILNAIMVFARRNWM